MKDAMTLFKMTFSLMTVGITTLSETMKTATFSIRAQKIMAHDITTISSKCDYAKSHHA
jgi:hypothetical protein